MPLKSSVAYSQLRVWGNVLVSKKINLIKECLLESLHQKTAIDWSLICCWTGGSFVLV